MEGELEKLLLQIEALMDQARATVADTTRTLYEIGGDEHIQKLVACLSEPASMLAAMQRSKGTSKLFQEYAIVGFVTAMQDVLTRDADDDAELGER